MIEVVKYTPDKKKEWDDFVDKSDVPIFLFNRDYLEYHSDRFYDSSLMIFNNKNQLIALLPGHIISKEFYSHLGLTFGGFITLHKTTYELFLKIINSTNKYLNNIGIKHITLKQIPSFYSNSLSQIQEYILKRNQVLVTDLKLASLIYSKNHSFPKSTIEKRKLNLEQFHYCESSDFKTYWDILSSNLYKHHKSSPIHSLSEIINLNHKFEKRINLHVITDKNTGDIYAGAVLYSFDNVLKLQYMATSEQGRLTRATHALYYSFIKEYIKNFDFIDLGSSMASLNSINTNLLYIKERFGSTVYPMTTYKYKTSIDFI